MMRATPRYRAYAGGMAGGTKESARGAGALSLPGAVRILTSACTGPTNRIRLAQAYRAAASGLFKRRHHSTYTIACRSAPRWWCCKPETVPSQPQLSHGGVRRASPACRNHSCHSSNLPRSVLNCAHERLDAPFFAVVFDCFFVVRKSRKSHGASAASGPRAARHCLARRHRYGLRWPAKRRCVSRRHAGAWLDGRSKRPDRGTLDRLVVHSRGGQCLCGRSRTIVKTAIGIETAFVSSSFLLNSSA